MPPTDYWLVNANTPLGVKGSPVQIRPSRRRGLIRILDRPPGTTSIFLGLFWRILPAGR
jgi:hypothetical protein